MSTIFNWKRITFGLIGTIMALCVNEPESMAVTNATPGTEAAAKATPKNGAAAKATPKNGALVKVTPKSSAAAKTPPSICAVTPKTLIADPLRIARIHVYFNERGPQGGGVGPVRIVLEHQSGKTTTIIGMGGGKYEQKDKQYHPTTGSHWTIKAGRKDNAYSEQYKAWMPCWVPFGDGQGFHVGGLRIRSHGCIHLSGHDAKMIYDHAPNGISVEIHVPQPKVPQRK